MDRYKYSGMTKGKGEISNPTHDHNQPRSSSILQPKPEIPALQTVEDNRSLTEPLKTPAHVSTSGMWHPAASTQDTVPLNQLHNPYVEYNAENMDIFKGEKHSQDIKKSTLSADLVNSEFLNTKPISIPRDLDVTSGAAFYKGLILYIPPFEQVSNTYRNSPAIKMLDASFKFSLKIPIKIEMKKNEIDPNMSDAFVMLQDQVIAKATGWFQAARVEVSVKALELLSKTCYTIQAKEDYFSKCKLIDASEIKSLDSKKWKEMSEKYPKLLEIATGSHVQKMFSVFLDSRTATGLYEDIVCCNLTRQDLHNIEGVVEFFHLTMLPCCVMTNQSKKHTLCAVSIHKFTSAKELLKILIESGGENDHFRLYPPNTFKNFYKLHPNYWDPTLQNSEKTSKLLESKTTLEDEDVQSVILNPFENIVAELLPKAESLKDDSEVRKAANNFMKETCKTAMAHSKNEDPGERMKLLLKYMELLQEYESQVLSSGEPEMIKVYHTTADILRKDLDTCRKDIEKEQIYRTVGTEEGTNETYCRHVSPPSQTETPPTALSSNSPGSQRHFEYSRKRSVSPSERQRSRSPRKSEKCGWS